MPPVTTPPAPEPPVIIRTEVVEAVVTASGAGARGRRGPQGLPGDDGAPGLSAYEVAVLDGFVGSEQDWLDSLNQGAAGVALAITAVAGEPISPLHAVALDETGAAVLASPYSRALVEGFLGVAEQGALTGEVFLVVTAGQIPSAAFAPGPLFLGAAGQLISAPPLTGTHLQIGTATSTAVLVRPLTPIYL